jgi:hypothetical protein
MAVSAARIEQVRSVIIEHGGRASASDIQAAMHLSNEPAYRAIGEALYAGLIERVGNKGARGTYYVVTDAGQTPTMGDAASTRQAILRIVDRSQPTDSQEIERTLSRDYPAFASSGLHKTQHIIHQLIKQGELEGRVERHGGVAIIVGVRIAKRRQNGVAVIDERSEIIEDPMPEPETLAVADASPDPVAQDVSPFPLLSELRLRESSRRASQARADALLAAASALEGFDLEEADRLFAKAATIASESELTQLEAEYLSYAESVR